MRFPGIVLYSSDTCGNIHIEYQSVSAGAFKSRTILIYVKTYVDSLATGLLIETVGNNLAKIN